MYGFLATYIINGNTQDKTTELIEINEQGYNEIIELYSDAMKQAYNNAMSYGLEFDSIEFIYC